ncbi:MAG: MarR family transcriptional regulator [Pseudomonadota bacterium]|nr:MarR family transcriptional regulator [Pseudomonadota bacterium]
MSRAGEAHEGNHRTGQKRRHIRGGARSDRIRASTLFSLLTPARIDLLDTLRRAGPCSVYALAKTAGRNYSNVHADVVRLIDLGLVERLEDETVYVPFNEIDIRLPLAQAA